MLNTRSASGASLPESANGFQIDWFVRDRLFIYEGRSNINRPLSVATSEWARLGNNLVRVVHHQNRTAVSKNFGPMGTQAVEWSTKKP